MNNNLTTLENAIYNSIPRLRELSSGCELESVISYIQEAELPIPIEAFFNEDGSGITKRQYGKVLLNKLCEELKSDFKKERHPILFNDVLVWISKLDFSNKYPITYLGEIRHNGNVICDWNLSKPALKDQSQELIDALYELIPK